MMKSILLFSTILALSGCSGGEFAASSTDFAPTAGSSGSGNEAGQTSEAGEPSSGGSVTGVSGSSTGGSGGDTIGGTAGSDPMGGGSGGSVAGQGGSGGSDPVGGNAGMAGSSTAGTGGIGPSAVCTPDMGRCTNLDFEVCSKDGTQWVKQETCGSVCSSTGCTGACKPGAAKCDGNDSLSCNAKGDWVKTTTCPFVCSGNGECTGICVPDSKQCTGKTPQTCSADGTWVDGTLCNNLCSAGVCTGACSPGTKQCNGSASQECQANGTWKDTTCTFVCGGAGVCSGVCVPGTKKCLGASIQICDVNGAWQTDSSCPFVCVNGACGGICGPNQPCNDEGNDCTQDICSADGMQCTHPNKANNSVCGSNANTDCNKPDTCQNGTCQQNFVAQNTACTSDSNPCTVDTCNAGGSCQHTAGNTGTVCRASSCTSGQVASEAKCDGASTACPASTKSDCYGACDDQGLMCAVGQPIKMADAYTMLSTDNDALYLYASIRNNSGTAQVLRIRKSDNAQTVLYSDNNGGKWIYAMLLAGNSLYLGETQWSGGTYTGSVTRIDTSTPNQTPTFIQSVATFGFAKNSTRVYWTDAAFSACDCTTPPTHHVYSTPINGDGTVSPFALNFGGEDLSPDIEVTDTDLYLWDMTNHSPGLYHPSLTRYNLAQPTTIYAGLIPGYFTSSGTPVQTISSVTNMPALTKNGTYIFANADSEIGTTVFSIKIANDAVVQLATDNQVSASSNFVADAQYVYFNNERVAVTGGSFSYTSAHSLATPSTLTLDGTYLYFGSYGYYTAPPYTFNVDVPLNALFKILTP